jgi:hypothetical protein
MLIIVYNLLIYSLFIYLDVISVKHKPLAPITNNMHINKLRNNLLNNSNEATDRTLNYNSHLINTPCYTTPHSSSRSTNTCPSTPTPRSPCSTDTRSSMAHNVHPSTPRTPRSTNARSFTSHSNNTNFNDNVFRSNTSNVFRSNTSLNDNTVIRPTFDAFNDDEFRSNNTSFRSNNVDFTPFRGMDNVHQICSWLCNNPDVLLLAYNMYMSMKASVMNEFNFILPNCNSSMSATSAPLVQEDKV